MDNGDAPATKRDIEQLRSEVKQNIERLRSEAGQLRSEVKQDIEQLRSEFHHGFDDLKETMRDAQTEVLKAFYGYAQTTDTKLKEGEQSDVMIRQRLTAVESRLLDVERRLNMPPQAQ